MGGWFVIANIPYFAEKDCFDSVEGYALRADGRIDNKFACRESSFDSPMQPKLKTIATVYDTKSQRRVAGAVLPGDPGEIPRDRSRLRLPMGGDRTSEPTVRMDSLAHANAAGTDLPGHSRAPARAGLRRAQVRDGAAAGWRRTHFGGNRDFHDASGGAVSVDTQVRQKVRQLYLFLKEANQLRFPPVRTLRPAPSCAAAGGRA